MSNETLNEKKQIAAELVCKAIADLNEKPGSTLRKIKNYINTEYHIPSTTIKKLIVPSLQNGVTFGVLNEKMGYYHLSDLMDNIVNLACKKGCCGCGSKCCKPKPSCRPERKCKRSSKNFRRIDYKSADICYEDQNNPKGCVPPGCEPCCDKK